MTLPSVNDLVALAEAQRRIELLAAELKDALRDVADYRATLAMTKTHADGVWFWSGKGDEPGSLVCPVVMDLAHLRAMLDVVEKAKELRRTWVHGTGSDMSRAGHAFDLALHRFEGP